jgi:hypothetical protein
MFVPSKYVRALPAFVTSLAFYFLFPKFFKIISENIWLDTKASSLTTDNKTPSQKSLKEQLERVYDALDSKYKPPSDWTKVSIQQSYYFPKINIIFTGIPKTGCSHWKELFLEAEGAIEGRLDYLPDVHNHTLSRPFRLPQFFRSWNAHGAYNRKIKTATSIVVFRNPWVRAVSAYRQKLSGEFRQGIPLLRLQHAILKSERNISGEQLYYARPTFNEFVRSLVRQRPWQSNVLLRDPHFKPQYTFLEVDKVRYDYIIPMEFVGIMSKDFLEKVRINMSLPGSYDKESNPRMQTSVVKAGKLFSRLDQHLEDNFYELYRFDFMLLGYSNFSDSNFPFPNYSLLQ